MKTIAVVTDSIQKSNRLSLVGEDIKSNLKDVFSNQVVINNYYINQLKKGDVISEDLILVMAGSRAIKIKDFVASPDNIIVVKRTFLKSGVNQLFSIPENADVLVVNDDIETVLESISSLYNIGIKHINLIPFEVGKDYRHISYAISPSEPELIPNYIPNKYDVKSRVIDIPTMLMIISKLNINNKLTQQNLYNYYQKIFSVNDGIAENYSTLLTRTEELDHLLDLSHDGILLTDKDGIVLICNKKFKDIFEINSDIINQPFHDVLSEINPLGFYNDDFDDDLVTYRNKSINVEKKVIVHFNDEIRMYFTFQEVTYIKKLEQNLSHKLRQKGHIAKYTFEDIVFSSPTMKLLLSKAEKIAKTDLTVLITGESGTGKEVLAQAIHNSSHRKNQPFIAINGAAIPENLLESELFGYVTGSFTGALKGGKKGLFEEANNGTIFLDEIGDMPQHLQSKLLRVLQERQISPIGSDRIIDIDVRVIAATHKNPLKMIDDGSFRKDLFYRLNVFPIELPALRDRKEDIPKLLHHFTNNQFTFTESFLQMIMAYTWPGNIRELHNIAQYISTIAETSTVDIDVLPSYIQNHFIDNPYEINDQMILSEKSDLEVTILVLNAINLLNEIKKTAGRKHLLNLINKNQQFISEAPLRRVLKELNLTELIETKKGRGGSHLTPKGKTYLESNINRSINRL